MARSSLLLPFGLAGHLGTKDSPPGTQETATVLLEGTGRPLLGGLGLSISPQGLRWNGVNQGRAGRAVLCLFFVFLFQGLQSQNPV